MMDPYVFDQCDGDEEAIDSALEEAKKNRKRLHTLLMVTGIARVMCGDYFEDSDWEDNWDDEIYNC